ncbi:MAG: tRNA methyltransferase [Thermoplasmata archaeon]|nr:MAG: tRNA methyltransferase [Thermoplasmata archaeon]
MHAHCIHVFIERIRAMIPDAEALFSAEQEWQSIRVNLLKIGRDELVERLHEQFEMKPIPWCEYGLFVRGNIAKTLEYFLGYYHIQGASSMLPPLALEPETQEMVLDMCAAPGSKTTQMAMVMERGIVVANDVNIKRLRALSHNIQKSGATNCIITNYDARFMYKQGFKSRAILLDAPCTASGRIIKDKHRLDQWNYHRIQHMSNVQKMLIRSACECLEKDGVLVYSTCSLEPEENEEVIAYALERFDVEIEPLSFTGIRTRPGLTSWQGRRYEGLERAVRVWPQDNGTEGFFICKLRKY